MDFSECSRVSLAFATRLAGQCGAGLHVLHAESSLLEAAARSRSINLPARTRAELRGFVEATCPGADEPPHYDVVSGRPADAICEAAARRHADAIVLGPHGRSRLQRAFLGSTTEAVLLRAAADVVVVPPAWTPPDAGRPGLAGVGPVVAAVRDPEDAAATVAAASALAAALHTTAETVHIDRGIQGDPGQALLDYMAAPGHQRGVLVLDRSRRRGRTELGPTTRTLLMHSEVPMLWRA